jgi:hypothetical protein
MSAAMTIEDVLRLRALSIRQPWASMIITGSKAIELRTWGTDYRGWLWIHSGKNVDADAMELLGHDAKEYQTGGLLGIAHLENVRKIETPQEWQALRSRHRSPSRFHEAVVGWHFSDTIALRKKIPSLGELGLFPLDAKTRDLMRASLEDDLDFNDAIESLPSA